MTTQLKTPFTKDDVKIVEKNTAFEGFFQLDQVRLKHRLFEGGWSGEMSREIFERGHAVAVLPYDPILDRVVFIEQFRPGAYAALSYEWSDKKSSPWLIECVAGIIEKGEIPVNVAKREMIEETGLEVSDLIKIFHYLVSPGGSSESVFLYCGKVDSTRANGIFGMTGEHENIRVFSTSTEEAFELLDQGKITNGMTIIGLQWLKINFKRLRTSWGS
jgi:ADP-ribose pyrophosphatase